MQWTEEWQNPTFAGFARYNKWYKVAPVCEYARSTYREPAIESGSSARSNQRNVMKSCLAVAALLLSIGGGGFVLQAQTADGMAPFIMDHRAAALSHSPIDVSFLLDAPAGRHGFIQ